MERALKVAREVRGHVWPNPPVGCVIVKDGRVVGEAATHPGGLPHAERKALDLAGYSAKRATLYVTLEPCCHWGKTPACVGAIIDKGVARVVCAIQDPDPRVNGGGFATLKGAGVDLTVGLCREEAQAVMSGFFHRVRFGSPELIASTESPDVIPDGADAVLTSGEEELVLTTRSGEVEHASWPRDRLLGWMGGLGLTTVAIPKQDAFWKEDQTSPAASAHRGRSEARLPSLGTGA